MSTQYLSVNSASWDVRTKEHVRSAFYDIDGFIQGKSSLKSVELDELGDISGKSILHLQCHFGLDSLSMARLGATVTGVDISGEAIKQANELQQRTGLTASFVCCDVYQTNDKIDTQFDVVYTSYGAIEWLPDINRWAKVVADSLVIGGELLLVEFHPYSYSLDGDPYFYQPDPEHIVEKSYTENASEEVPLYVWSHPISNVINALIKNGMEILQLNEYPYATYNCFDALVEKEPGKFYREDAKVDIPMMYSLKARKR